MLKGLFKNASFGPQPNLHKRTSIVEVYRLGQCLGWTFSLISTVFFLLSSRTFRDAPHSRFRCGDPNQCLSNFLKMQLLALPQIYTRVFNLWISIDFNCVWVGVSRPYQLSFLSQVLARLEMRPTRGFGVGISNYANRTF